MDLHTALQIAGIAAGVAAVVVAFYLIGFVSKVKETLEQVNKTLGEVSTVVTDIDTEIKPLISSAQQTLDQMTELGQKGGRLVEDVSALPPAIKELTSTFKDIFRDLALEIKETLSKLEMLIQNTDKRVTTEVPEVLKQVEALTEELNAIVGDVHQKLAKTDELFKAVEEAGRASKLVAQIVSQNVAETAIEVAAVATGLRTTLKVLREKLRLGGVENV